MKKKYVEMGNRFGKISLLLVFTFMSIGSNPDSKQVMLMNENENLYKMVDIEQISFNRIVNKVNSEEVKKLANELNKNTEINLSRLAENMDVGEPSGFTLEQFKKALVNSSNIRNDKYDVIKSHVEDFYLAEHRYGINGIFLMSIAVHESGWGTSKLALNSNNLFGYIGMRFETYGSCIDYVGKTLMTRYLNPKGTIIKGVNQPASGVYHRGTTVASVNIVYAADPQWNKKVFNYMQHFYKNIEG